MNKLLLLLESIFTKTYFYKINKFMYLLSLKGMGVENKYDLVYKGDEMILNKLVKKTGKQVVFDIGANVGNYAEAVLKYNKEVELFAFEPHPKTFLKLEEKAKQVGFKTINKGCADTNGKLSFYDYANNDGSEHATLLEGVFTDIHNNQTIVHQVDVITLDSFINEHNITSIDLLKIDTEGYEYSVMCGCINAIKANKIKVVHFEFNTMNIISKVFMKDFIKILPQYTFYRVLPNGLLKIEKEKTLLTEIFGFQNIVAVNTQTN